MIGKLRTGKKAPGFSAEVAIAAQNLMAAYGSDNDPLKKILAEIIDAHKENDEVLAEIEKATEVAEQRIAAANDADRRIAHAQKAMDEQSEKLKTETMAAEARLHAREQTLNRDRKKFQYNKEAEEDALMARAEELKEQADALDAQKAEQDEREADLKEQAKALEVATGVVQETEARYNSMIADLRAIVNKRST